MTLPTETLRRKGEGKGCQSHYMANIKQFVSLQLRAGDHQDLTTNPEPALNPLHPSTTLVSD